MVLLKDISIILICFVIFSQAQVVANETPLQARIKSARQLRELGKALLIYANDNQDRYPEDLNSLKDYLQRNNLNWIVENIEYLGKGKRITNPPDIPIAYDVVLLGLGQGTNVLYNDSHVAFENPEMLKKLDIIVCEQGQKAREAAKVKNLSDLAGKGVFTISVANPNGDPATGVRLYSHFSGRDTGIPTAQFISDEKGLVTIYEQDLFRYEYQLQQGVLLYALSSDNRLGGFLEIQHKDVGKKLQLMLEPLCKVDGRLKSSSLEQLGQKLEWTNVYVYKDRQRPLSYSSKRSDFEFLLPPGRYRLYAYGTDTYSLNQEIEIESGQQKHEVALDLPADKLATLMGKAAPEFRNIKGWINSEPLKLSELRDKVVLLDFWGYWCGPCIAAMPKLMQLHDKFSKHGLIIIAVHDDSLGSIEELQQKLKDLSEKRWSGQQIRFAIALDGGGETKIEGTDRSARGATTAAYGIQAWPTSVLIDKKGNVVMKFHSSSPDAIEELLLGLQFINQSLEGKQVVPKGWVGGMIRAKVFDSQPEIHLIRVDNNMDLWNLLTRRAEFHGLARG